MPAEGGFFRGLPAFRALAALRVRLETLSGRPSGLLLPPLLAGLFCALALAGPDKFSGSLLNYAREAKGGFLLAGIPEPGLTRAMPLFGALFAGALNAGFSAQAFSLLLLFANYLLVFCAGGLLGGYAAGLLALGAAGLLELAGGFGFDTEQALYCASLLLVVCTEALRVRRSGARWQALAGFSVGISLLVRSPLALLPFFALLAEALTGGLRRPGAARRALLYLAASFALLLPWSLLNRSLTGSFSPLDSARATGNLVTSALGSVYTMEGDYDRLGGLRPGESALPLFLRSVAADPAGYAASVLRRAWRLFLLHPVLLLLFAAGFALSRDPDRLRLYLPALYFLLPLAAFSLEPRYLYPLLFLLPPYFAAAAAGGGGEPCEAKRYLAVVYGAAAVAAGAVLLLAAAYPARAARASSAPGVYAAAAARFPRDRVFLWRACRERWLAGDDGAHRACLAAYGARFGDATVNYFLAVTAAADPRAVPAPPCRDSVEPCMERAMLLGLRLAELGRAREGAAELGRAFSLYEAGLNMLRGEPYAADRAVAAEIRRAPGFFWDRFLYDQLLFWPPGALLKILESLQKEMPLEGMVLAARRGLASSGGAPEKQRRGWLANGPGGRPPWVRESAGPRR